MKALVIYDTKHGSSANAAAAVALGLGRETSLRPLEAAPTELSGYDLVVLGAPIYFGAWSKNALAWLAGNEAALEGGRLALFALGSMPNDYPAIVKEALGPRLAAKVAAFAQFGGRIPTEGVGFFERLVIGMVGKAGAKSGVPARELDLVEAENFGRELAASLR
ncbi:MAG: flavodoxin domain-containing protein [Spirochaetaceae bacterium]|nr:flavodoxin domain-containing protein [Spirochaetaceae bacterium]